MWALLPRRVQLYAVAGASIVIAWAAQWLIERVTGAQSGPVSQIGPAVFLIGTVLAGLLSWSWRNVWSWLPFLEKKFFPDLTGVWSGELRSTWTNPQTGTTLAPIPTTITIRQGLFNTFIKMKTGESSSHSTRCILEHEPNAGRFRLWYTYSNTPKAEHHWRSARHEGVAWLEIDVDEDRDLLAGQYFSDRRTTGDMMIKRISREVGAAVVQPPAPGK